MRRHARWRPYDRVVRPEPVSDPLTIQRVLHGAKTIAIVGLSKNFAQRAISSGSVLRRHGCRVIPVNPASRKSRGEELKSLLDVPVSVDIVNVFRAGGAARHCWARRSRSALFRLWVPVSVINEEGGRIAEAAVSWSS